MQSTSKIACTKLYFSNYLTPVLVNMCMFVVLQHLGLVGCTGNPEEVHYLQPGSFGVQNHRIMPHGLWLMPVLAWKLVLWNIILFWLWYKLRKQVADWWIWMKLVINLKMIKIISLSSGWCGQKNGFSGAAVCLVYVFSWYQDSILALMGYQYPNWMRQFLVESGLSFKREQFSMKSAAPFPMAVSDCRDASNVQVIFDGESSSKSWYHCWSIT